MLEGQDSFIYSLAVLPSTMTVNGGNVEYAGGHLITAGEDGIVKIWDGGSSSVQQNGALTCGAQRRTENVYRRSSYQQRQVSDCYRLATTNLIAELRAVWTIATLANGDIAVGCSDRRIWIFTQSADRFAEDALEKVRLSLRRIRAF